LHIIVPFRGRHADLLPSLLKSIARAWERPSLLQIRVLIAPVYWNATGRGYSVQSQVLEAVNVAKTNLDLDILVVDPISEDALSSEELTQLLRPWLDNEDVDPLDFTKDIDNSYVAALLGALKRVPKVLRPLWFCCCARR
jgi:hypothetical protein